MKIILTYFFLLATILIYSQNKTLKDTTFKVGDVIRISEVLNINRIIPDSTKIVADFLKLHKNICFELASHTDSRGKAANNYTLSTARANYIRQNLIVEHKVDSTQIKAKGYGSTKPIIPEKEIIKAKTQEQKENLYRINRRLELKVLTIK